MGRIRKGILGGFSGTVGTVVGASWKGKAYMRSLPLKVRNPRTVLQMEQRAKFALTIKYLRPMTGLLRIGWKLYAHGQSPFNAAMSYTIANAITGSYPHYAIDPSKVLISRGSLSPALNAVAVPSAGGSISFDWDDNSGSSAAMATDKVLLAVINPAKDEAVFDTCGTTRADTSMSVNLPLNWIGAVVHVYLGIISQDSKEAANSVYLGALTVI